MAKQKVTSPPATHFVVSRLTWRPAGYARMFVRLPGETRVAAFADFDSAEADRAKRELAARATVNPFRCGTNWGERSHMPEAVFRDFIKDAGIEPPTIVEPPTTDEDGKPLSRQARRLKQKEPPPPETFRSWDSWWDAVGPTLSAERVARVWEGLDRVRFFSVEERPVRTVAYVVVEISWSYNDEWYYPPAEGGGAHSAYRTRERAEAECARLNHEARERWRDALNLPEAEDEPEGMPGYEAYPFDMEGRLFPGDDPFGPRRTPPARGAEDQHGKFAVDEVPFYEVIEFELERP
jgi:hypothetical protein